MSSIVVNRAGEWKLTGFEYTHAIEETTSPYKVLNSLSCYDPPEKSPIGNLKPNRNSNAIPTESAVDSWSFGCLIWEIFNQLLSSTNSLKTLGKVNTNKNENIFYFISLNSNSNVFELKDS